MHGFWVFLAIVIALLALAFGFANRNALKELMARDAKDRQAVVAAMAGPDRPIPSKDGGPLGFCPPR
jgi:hypothetical protein